jgi:hypothetical protein
MEIRRPAIIFPESHERRHRKHPQGDKTPFLLWRLWYKSCHEQCFGCSLALREVPICVLVGRTPDAMSPVQSTNLECE